MKPKTAAVAASALIIGLFIGNFAETPEDSRQTFSENGSASAKVVGASGTSGIVGEVNVDIEPGDGDVLVATAPYVKANTQASARLAKKVAEAYTDTSLENRDVTYSFNVSSGLIGGPSAGAAMTLATIAAIEDREVRDDAVITGTITENGRIGKVGGITAKARAAGEKSLEALLVPKGQSTRVNYRPVVERERRGLFVYRDVEYRREVFDIGNFTQENFGMATREVGNLSEAAELMLKD